MRDVSCLLTKNGFGCIVQKIIKNEISGRTLSYIETFEDILEISPDLITIKCRELLSLVNQWKRHGVKTTEVNPAVPTTDSKTCSSRSSGQQAKMNPIIPRKIKSAMENVNRN